MFNSGEIDSVYQELRKIAALHLARSVRTPTLQATQLVHEAWLRLSAKGFHSRTHFLALASRTMRMMLIDAARARMAESRGAGQSPLALEDDLEFCTPTGASTLDRVIDIDRALTDLAARDPRKAQVVEMRFFGGLELHEIAEVLDVSLATIKRDWEFARTWLFTRLSSK